MNEIKNLKPFPKFCYSIGYIPTSYKVAMTYEEQLVWLCDYLENTVIPAVNNNGHAVEELQNLFVELKQYVDDYFSDLNVQTEINNKLDDMAESGELAEIINEQIFNDLNTQVETNTGDIADLKDADINLQGNINTLANNLEANRNPIDFYVGKNLVVFGDSFSQPDIPNSEDEYWVKKVCQATGLISYNFAIAGAGFGRSTNLLTSQLTTAQQQMTNEQKQNTSVVIMYAGYNDIANNVSDEEILSNFISLVTNTHETFPNAKIIAAPFNWGYGSLTRDYNKKIERLLMKMIRDTAGFPITFLKMCRYWLLGVVSNFRNEVHPSVNGFNIIASYMIGAIYGSSEHVSIGGTLTPTHGLQTIDDFTFEDGIVNFVFGVKFENELNDYSGEQYSDLHALLTPETDIIIPLYALDGQKGTLRLTNEGKGYLRNITVPSNTWLLANITFVPQAFKSWNG